MNGAAVGPLLAAVAARQALSVLWWSPQLFARQYVALAGLTPGDTRTRQPLVLAIDTAGGFLMAIGFGFIAGIAQVHTALGGIGLGLLLWLGFVAVPTLSITLYERRPLQLFMISAGYQLAVMVSMGVIFGVWHTPSAALE